MKKGQWVTPELQIILRRKPEESVLFFCKYRDLPVDYPATAVGIGGQCGKGASPGQVGPKNYCEQGQKS